MRRRGAFQQREAETLTRQRVFELTVSIEFAYLAQPSGITPALTERRERFEFVSGVDGKIGDSRPSAERADPDARCRFGSTNCYPSTDDFALYILASLPSEVEFVRVWSGFSAVMPEFGWCGQAIRWAFRSAYLCLLPRLRHERSGSEHVASAFEGILSMPDYAVTLAPRRDNARVNRGAATRIEDGLVYEFAGRLSRLRFNTLLSSSRVIRR